MPVRMIKNDVYFLNSFVIKWFYPSVDYEDTIIFELLMTSQWL